jgi:sugar O-acyltransferase (sialic acid O-acetyltransferase NeuD family)
MKRKIVLIGGGGHCKSVINTICRAKLYEDIVITDNSYPQMRDVLGIPVVGTDENLLELRESGYEDAFITVGSIKRTDIRWRLCDEAVHLGFRMPCIIDPSAQISQYAELGAGIFVGQGAIVNAGADIGDAAIINTGTIIEHDCTIGRYTHVAVGAKLCGAVSVGNDTLIGAGSVIVQNVHIGNHVSIGAGSIVLRDVKDHETAVGTVK